MPTPKIYRKYKVTVIPISPLPDSIYYVYAGDKVDEYITDEFGSIRPVGNAQYTNVLIAAASIVSVNTFVDAQLLIVPNGTKVRVRQDETNGGKKSMYLFIENTLEWQYTIGD